MRIIFKNMPFKIATVIRWVLEGILLYKVHQETGFFTTAVLVMVTVELELFYLIFMSLLVAVGGLLMSKSKFIQVLIRELNKKKV